MVSSLNRFGAYPREGHLDLTVRCFSYVKTTQDKKTAIDSRPVQLNCISPSFRKLIPDFTKDYPNSAEEMDLVYPHYLDLSCNQYS